MSYDPTGEQGPPGATGATGGGGTAQGITGSIQFNDGSGGFTGSSGFLWTETGGIGQNASIITGGLNGNYFNMDAPGSMQIGLGQVDVGNSITLSGGSTIISLIDGVPTDNPPIDGSLQVIINAYGGVAGEYLGSDGSGKVTWSIPPKLDAGLENTLQIVSAIDVQTSENAVYGDFEGGIYPPSSWIEGTTLTSAQPLAGGTNAGWRNFKQVGVTGSATSVQWSPYNPYFEIALPYDSSPVTPFTKNDLKSLWAVITTQNRIITQGTIFFNIYTYDLTNPPTAPDFYTNRFDYSIGLYPTMYGSGVTTNQTLAGGFKYLICAVDSPKIVQDTLRTISPGTLNSVLITGTAGQFSSTARTLFVGQKIIISGTLIGTGTISGYTGPKTYYIITTNGTTTFTLSETLGGSAITTTAGTTLGLTFTNNVLTEGNKYTILVIGDVNWVAIGAAVDAVGCVFVKNATTATGTSGTATEEINTSILIGNGQDSAQTGFLKDPYDIYTTIPHVQFNAVKVASNNPQPASPSSILVSKIVIGTGSGAISPTLDWTLEACGFSTTTGLNNVYYLTVD
jgi:hypothetical protein